MCAHKCANTFWKFKIIWNNKKYIEDIFFSNTEHGRIRSPVCTDTNLEFLPKCGGVDSVKTQPLMITQGADPRTFSQSQVHSKVLLRSLRCFQDEDTRGEHCCYCGRSGVFKHLNHPERNPTEIPLKSRCSWLNH